eukprot:CAMPEP_0185791988 /NCGR_PEP_ID=MMETSP1174-20130828/158680_1 /TAXON_ID=35687 /ORGANISM="Dictyocha speculum, Strain CCMP1381" /LENGTH=348 /DNA_ID=CAMNT_0028487001 /DNA_START=19 /DNA_END=1066 /DNA_ORIENTATION=+
MTWVVDFQHDIDNATHTSGTAHANGTPHASSAPMRETFGNSPPPPMRATHHRDAEQTPGRRGQQQAQHVGAAHHDVARKGGDERSTKRGPPTSRPAQTKAFHLRETSLGSRGTFGTKAAERGGAASKAAPPTITTRRITVHETASPGPQNDSLDRRDGPEMTSPRSLPTPHDVRETQPRENSSAGGGDSNADTTTTKGGATRGATPFIIYDATPEPTLGTRLLPPNTLYNDDNFTSSMGGGRSNNKEDTSTRRTSETRLDSTAPTVWFTTAHPKVMTSPNQTTTPTKIVTSRASDVSIPTTTCPSTAYSSTSTHKTSSPLMRPSHPTSIDTKTHNYLPLHGIFFDFDT